MTVKRWGDDMSNCRCCLYASVHQTVPRSWPQRHLYATTCETAHTMLLELLCIDVQRSGRAKPQIWEVDGRVDEETEGWIRVHSIRMHRKALFSAFLLLARWKSVWDFVWSASVRSLQSPSNTACMHTGRDKIQGFYQVEQWKISLERIHTLLYTNSSPCCIPSVWTSFCWGTNMHTA